MFLYTVYGVSAVQKDRERRVGRISAIEPPRAVTPSWRSQYGNREQPQRIHWLQDQQRDYIQALADAQSRKRAAEAREEPSVEPETEAPPSPGPRRNLTSELSDLYIRNAATEVAEQRSPTDYTDVDLFHKHQQRLDKARGKKSD